MVHIVQSKYFIETTPIRMTESPSGGKQTDIDALNMRVVDSYTRMPVGMVVYREKFHAIYFLSEEKSDEIEGEWGPRFDRAVHTVWKAYSKSLPCYERLKRWGWRWLGVGWFLFGIVLGGLMSFIVQAIT